MQRAQGSRSRILTPCHDMTGRPIEPRALALLAITAIAIIALGIYGPIPQPAGYHEFADQRSLVGIPHFANTLSNLPFLLVGIAGIFLFRHGIPAGALAPLKPAYLVLFASVALLFFGSAWYHLAPSDATLAWDRLPMTLAFMAFFAAIIGEHISLRLGRRLLLPLLMLGVLSVVYWRLSDSGDGGDLRLYVLVQFLPMLLIPAIILLYPPALRPMRHVWALLGLYGVAKVLECLDEPVLRATGLVSGHTVKHLVAAIAVYAFLLGLSRRRPVPSTLSGQ
jgi:hypothetical protein